MRCLFLALTFVAMLQSSVSGQIPIATGESLPLYYDVRTGNVTIDTTNVFGGVLLSYSFKLPPDGYRHPEFGLLDLSYRHENLTPFMDTFFTSTFPKQIGENGSGIAPGVYSLGNVLPADLDEQEFQQYFGDAGPPGSQTYYRYHAIGAPGGQTYNPFTPLYSPSPYPPLNTGDETPLEVTWADEASLLYDPESGGLWLDTSGPGGGTIWSYRLDFGEDSFDQTAVQFATDGLLADVTPTYLVEIGVDGIPAGTYSLGDIVPAGLSLDELPQAVTGASFIGEPGHGAHALDIDTNGIPLAMALMLPALPCDFDRDGLCGLLDIDQLVTAIETAADDPAFDLNGDGLMDTDDISGWLADAAQENGFAEPYLSGDVNLDGTVNAADLNVLALNWQQPGRTWSTGNMYVDELAATEVNTDDLNRVALSWQQSISGSAAAAVPEPSGALLGLIATSLLLLTTRQARKRDP